MGWWSSLPWGRQRCKGEHRLGAGPQARSPLANQVGAGAEKKDVGMQGRAGAPLQRAVQAPLASPVHCPRVRHPRPPAGSLDERQQVVPHGLKHLHHVRAVGTRVVE